MAVSGESLSNKIEKTSIKEQLKKEIEENEFAVDEKYSHKEDLEKLLSLAENLKDSCDRAKSSIKRQRILTVIIAILILFIMLYHFLYFNPTNNINYLIIFAGFAAIALLVAFDQLFLVNNPKQRYLADKLALSEVLQLLRETSNIIAEQEEWSVLSRAEFRIRLSRFNLDEKSKSAFNLFS